MEFNKEPKLADDTFIKLKDGESIMGVFVGNPEEFYVKWENKKSELCDEDTPGAKFRFRLNIAVFDKDDIKMKIWEQGPTVYNNLKAINTEVDLSTKLIKIMRTGSTMNDTNYTVLPLKDVPADKMRQIQDLESNDLKKENDVKNYAPTLDTSEDLPF